MISLFLNRFQRRRRAWRRLRGGGGSSVVRVFRLTSARSVWGIQKNSAWSVLSAHSSKHSTTSSTKSTSSTALRLNAGTQTRVTSVTMPSAPRPTLATCRRSGSVVRSQLTTVPSPATMRSPTTPSAMLRNPRPVPWVEVAMAPATDW